MFEDTYLTLVKLPTTLYYFQVRIFGSENREENILLEQTSHAHTKNVEAHTYSVVNWFLVCYLSLDRGKNMNSFILVRVHSEILFVKNDRCLRETEN